MRLHGIALWLTICAVNRILFPMPKSPKKTERDAALVADFLAGMPSRELAAKYGITRQRVSHITKAAGVRRDKVFVLSERVRRMIEAAPALAAEGLTKSAAARRLGVTHSHFVQVVACQTSNGNATSAPARRTSNAWSTPPPRSPPKGLAKRTRPDA